MKQNNKTQQKKSFIGRVFGWMWRKKWWLLTLLVVIGGAWWIFGDKTQKPGEFITMNITRGDLRQVDRNR